MSVDVATAEFKAKFQRLVELRETRDIDKAAAKRSEAAYRESEAELFAELQDAGIRGRLEFDFGPELGTVKFQRRSTPYGRIIDKAAAVEAFKKLGKHEIIYEESIREGRLNEFVRDTLETHGELPTGVDFYHREGISISRK